MSTVDYATAVTNSVSASRTAVQIAVPLNQPQGTTADADLEAAVNRVATLLYMRSHLDVPPDVTDMGGGIFNVLV
jgi:hypothetical protein